MIAKDSIQQVFDDLDAQGEMDTMGPLLYGYFFTDADSNKLFEVSEELQNLGYKFVDIIEADLEDEDDDKFYYLHIEKVETHTIDSLDLINKEFYKFADKYNLESYDGFDVGNVNFDPSK